VYAELSRDHIQNGSEFILMRRDHEWKIVLYLDDEYGELYDLNADACEVNNLWESGEVRSLRDELVKDCLRWLARGSLSANRRSSRAPQKAMSI
jgi:arylsulfatase